MKSGRVILRPLWVALLLLTVTAGATSAATFVVNTTAPTYDGVCDAADCTLIDAILEAESNGLADDIVLQNCAVYTLPLPYAGTNGLPQILTTVRLIGNGAVIQRAAGAPAFRLLEVRPTGNLAIENLTLRNGFVTAPGGGIMNTGTLAIRNSVIEDNTVDGTTGSWGGGGIYNRSGSLQLERTTLRRNSAVTGGGLASDGWPGQASTVFIANSAIANNSAFDFSYNAIGGGMLIRGDNDATIRDTTVSGNSSQFRGGGIYFHSVPIANSVLLRNVTVTRNTASSQGGGLYFQVCGATCPIPTSPLVENTIVANNVAGSANDWVGNYTSGGNNIIGTGIGTFPPATGDQFVVSLANLGLPTTTGDAGGEHHRPLPGCTAINAANNALCASGDQLGLGRVSTCEIGAIEFRRCFPAPSDLYDWWPFDETSGSTAQDMALFANNGTHVNGPAPSPGMVSGALCFNGVNQTVRVADHPEVNFLGDCSNDIAEPFTIDAWVKTCASGLQVILDKRETAPSFLRGYHLFIFNGRLGFQMATGAGNSVCGSVGSACTNFVSPVPGPNDVDLRDNRWHFIAVTVTRCQAATGKMYIDGNLVHTFTPRVGDITNNRDLLIGERYPISSTVHFRGCIDELEFFKRALDEPELDAIYDAGWAGKCRTTCQQSPFPQCGGTCPAGQVCTDNQTTDQCDCKDEVPPCHQSAPACNGPCPDPVQHCIFKQGVGCLCVEPAGLCSGGGGLQCSGLCPDPSKVCKAITPPPSICDCVAIAVPCTQAPLPACGGVCPPGQQCKIGAAGCHCVACTEEVPASDALLYPAGTTRFIWTRSECASSYNVYRGTASPLVDSDGDGVADDYGACMSSRMQAEEVEDPSRPSTGRMLSYLVSGSNPLGEGSLGFASNGLSRPNNGPCP